MFDSPEFPASLNQELFEDWFEIGRDSKIPYNYLVIVWNAHDEKYLPVFTENRAEVMAFPQYGNAVNEETMIAAYDLYSESRILT